jgi:threonyl-tRNA synthetase
MVPAGMTAGAAIRGRKAPTYEPNALGVAGDKQGALYDLNWAPESDIEVA